LLRCGHSPAQEGYRPIEEFKVGEMLLSRSEYDLCGEIQAKEVEEVFVRIGRVLHLHVAGQIIKTTPEHPFYARDKGWIAAAQLQVGDLLLSHDGQRVTVVDLLDTGEFETMYNLQEASSIHLRRGIRLGPQRTGA
jgi:intein/homing endonuclease